MNLVSRTSDFGTIQASMVFNDCNCNLNGCKVQFHIGFTVYGCGALRGSEVIKRCTRKVPIVVMDVCVQLS